MVEFDSLFERVTVNGGELRFVVPENEGLVSVGVKGVLDVLFDELWTVDL